MLERPDTHGGTAADAADTVLVDHPPRSNVALVAKRIVQGLFTMGALPWLLAYAVSRRVLGARAFMASSESISRIPGMRGNFLRQAFYRRTLASCGQDVSFGWLSTFSMHQASVGDGTYIGRHCGIGFAKIGSHVMLADGVQILSGGKEHGISSDTQATHKEQVQTFSIVTIGDGAWVGTNAVIMASVGENCVIGAGAVVTKPIPANSVAVGSPARVSRTLAK
ncbi:MAG: virginiamycin A acetyltransferase [Gammaproteobacteria bacterium]|jgi:virginiamycin A acetyltransferase